VDSELNHELASSHARRRPFRQFLWTVAGADAGLLTSGQVSACAGIKYSTIGAAVVMTTLTAAAAWYHNFASMLPDSRSGVGMAAAGGVGMAALLGTIERLLIVSIPPMITQLGRCLALSWRSLIAVMNAAILALPLALGWYGPQIALWLDGEKLARMERKQDAVKGLFPLADAAQAVQAADLALEKTEDERQHLPGDILDLRAQAQGCEAVDRRLEQTRWAWISRAESEASDLRRARPDLPPDIAVQLDRLRSRVARWKRELAYEAKKCNALRARLNSATQAFLAERQAAYQDLFARRKAAEEKEAALTRKANDLLRQSNTAVTAAATPSIGAEVHGLFDLISADREVRSVVMLFVAFFAMIDLMPLIAKLCIRGDYEHTQAARERTARARMQAAAVIQEAQAARKAEAAAAELAGFRRLYSDAGVALYAEHARTRAATDLNKAHVWAAFEDIDTLCRQVEHGYRRIDEAAFQLHGKPEAQDLLDDIRDLLRAAAKHAALKLQRESATAPLSGANPLAEAAE
jgi:hypothetical protein